MEQLIEHSKKLTSLLIEYRESLEYEKCIYHLVNDDSVKGYYFLYRIEDRKELIYGSITRLKSYINLRCIDINTIYNNSQLTN